MARAKAQAKQNWFAFFLQLLGSVIFLWVVFAGIPQMWSALFVGSGIFAGVGSFWAPIFLGASVISSVALFFASFGEITGWNGPRLSMMGLETSAVAGLTLAAMTWTSQPLLWASVIGFVLTFLGSAMSSR
jgi:hypothetical protein